MDFLYSIPLHFLSNVVQLSTPHSLLFKLPASDHCSVDCFHTLLQGAVFSKFHLVDATIHIVGVEKCYRKGLLIYKQTFLSKQYPLIPGKSNLKQSNFSLNLCPLEFPSSSSNSRGSITYHVSIRMGGWLYTSRKITVIRAPPIESLTDMVKIWSEENRSTNILCTIEGSRLLFIHTTRKHEQIVVSPFRPTLLLGEGFDPIVSLQYGILEITEAFAGKYKSFLDFSKPVNTTTSKMFQILYQSSITTGERIPLEIYDLVKCKKLAVETSGKEFKVTHDLVIKLYLLSGRVNTFRVPIQIIHCP
ncbi:hypothetical protein BC833DRAFT_616432 [Globomyces pollinis-pini]|nr:hypothetical protein BC833DRAFT_616432 [Globomyces pollinis-pini]